MHIIIENNQDYTNVKFEEDRDKALKIAEDLGTSPTGVTVIYFGGNLNGMNVYIGHDCDVAGGETIYEMYEGELQ